MGRGSQELPAPGVQAPVRNIKQVLQRHKRDSAEHRDFSGKRRGGGGGGGELLAAHHSTHDTRL